MRNDKIKSIDNPKLGIPERIKTKEPDSSYIKSLRNVMHNSNKFGKTDKLFLGCAGEFYVASNLLRIGLNPASLPVDTGVDLLAHREFKTDILMQQAEHELFQFQIKTTATDDYRASLPEKKVNELWHKNINLIVVFWKLGTIPSAIVLPPSLIRMLTSGGFRDPCAPLFSKQGKVSLRVYRKGDYYFIRNTNHEITAMLNRFDRIEPIGTDTGMFPSYACWADGNSLISFDRD
jgi:hypothetical protein